MSNPPPQGPPDEPPPESHQPPPGPPPERGWAPPAWGPPAGSPFGQPPQGPPPQAPPPWSGPPPYQPPPSGQGYGSPTGHGPESSGQWPGQPDSDSTRAWQPMSQQPPPNAGFPPPPPSSRRNSRRLIIGAIGGVIILVVVIGFAALHGGHSPKDVVTTYLDAYESRDCSKARDQLTLALQEQFGTCDQDEGNYVLASGDTMTYSSVKVTNQTDSAATAQSTVTVNGQPQAITFALVKENGDWKISSAG